LDTHQHHQRALCPRLTHGSLDLQRNDRLGRRRSHQRFEHRREILCAVWSYTYTDGDAYCNPNGNCHSNLYFDTETFTNAETGANA
jgi:hypothetical protein